MKILAHRGLPGDGAPENSLAAFERAVAAGVDGIETDVRVTRDGVLVLHHDRLLADGRELAETGWDALAVAATRLEDALAAWPALLWNLELKDRRALPALARRLARRPPGEVLLSSFDHQALSEADLPGHVRRGALLAHRPAPRWPGALPPAAPRPGGVHAIVVEAERLDAALAAQAREAGLSCWAYGAQSLAEHAALAALGLEALVTDHPDRARGARPAR